MKSGSTYGIQWYKFDDENVMEVKQSGGNSRQSAYMLVLILREINGNSLMANNLGRRPGLQSLKKHNILPVHAIRDRLEQEPIRDKIKKGMRSPTESYQLILCIPLRMRFVFAAFVMEMNGEIHSNECICLCHLAVVYPEDIERILMYLKRNSRIERMKLSDKYECE
eukprot:115774_1